MICKIIRKKQEIHYVYEYIIINFLFCVNHFQLNKGFTVFIGLPLNHPPARKICDQKIPAVNEHDYTSGHGDGGGEFRACIEGF